MADSIIIPRNIAWFYECLGRGKTERFTFPDILISPELATEMLKFNTRNRPLSEANVKTNIQRLRTNRFVLHHQGIAFSKTNVLNDGQTRLTAISRSNIAGRMQITFGCEDEEFKAIDSGNRRKPSDNISVAGYDNSTLRGSVARNIIMVKEKTNSPDNFVVNELAIAMAEEPELIAALKWGNKVKGVIPPTPITVSHYWIAKHTKHPDKMDKFWHGIDTGEGLVALRLKLREWLRKKTVPSNFAGGDRNVYTSGIIILNWNNWIKDKTLFSTAWNNRLEFPTVL